MGIDELRVSYQEHMVRCSRSWPSFPLRPVAGRDVCSEGVPFVVAEGVQPIEEEQCERSVGCPFAEKEGEGAAYSADIRSCAAAESWGEGKDIAATHDVKQRLMHGTTREYWPFSAAEPRWKTNDSKTKQPK